MESHPEVPKRVAKLLLQLLHRHCHDAKTRTDGSTGAHVRSPLIEEPDEVKVSRPVLKTSGFSDKIA